MSFKEYLTESKPIKKDGNTVRNLAKAAIDSKAPGFFIVTNQSDDGAFESRKANYFIKPNFSKIKHLMSAKRECIIIVNPSNKDRELLITIKTMVELEKQNTVVILTDETLDEFDNDGSLRARATAYNEK